MGARGPAPKPTAIKLLEGNPGKRPLPPAGEPQPAQAGQAPAAPLHLTDLAREEWERVAPELHRLGLLTSVDSAALEMYCEAYATWRCAQNALADGALVYVTSTGNFRARPELGIARAAAAQLAQLCAQFGLTPSARGRMALPKQEPKEDPFDSYLKRKGSGG